VTVIGLLKSCSKVVSESELGWVWLDNWLLQQYTKIMLQYYVSVGTFENHAGIELSFQG
jgi:hypothetical protein